MKANERKMEDKMFILSAVSIELHRYVNENKQDYLDDYGIAHFYDMCADIVNEMTDGVDYQDYLSDNNLCLDWYFMDKAPSMFTNERIRRVAGLK
jgi:hypothetical protein